MNGGKFGSENTAGQRLRKDRIAAGLDVRTFAALIQRSRSHIRNVENGHRPITAYVAETAAAVLGTDPDRYRTTDTDRR